MPTIRVHELARRLCITSNTTVTSADIVAWAEAAGVRVSPRGSLDESQAHVVLRTTRWGGTRQDIQQLVAPEWPPARRSWSTGYQPSRLGARSAIPRQPAVRPVPALPPAKPVISESARRAAAQARPAPPPQRPLLVPLPAVRPGAARDRRRRGGGPPSVSVRELPGLVRALLPEHLQGRERISLSEAQQWREEAGRWAREGFDDRSVRRWLGTELGPRDAGYLASRRVNPDVLDKLIPVPVTVMAAGYAMASLMLVSRRLPVEAVYDLLVRAGHHKPVVEPELVLARPVTAPVTRPAAPPVVFSNPGDVNDPVFAVVPSQRRRTAKAIQDGDRRNRSRR
ncbi:hypothetical protein [Micromonospora sp. NPDC051141]|uniref:hypothetical protein n=1 Tax=Micromonospora sp. NPDC051141 TaxID=3364284 RepID=UPI0037948D29